MNRNMKLVNKAIDSEAFVDYDIDNLKSTMLHWLAHAEAIVETNEDFDLYGTTEFLSHENYRGFIEACIIVPRNNEFYHDHFLNLWDIFLEHANEILRDIWKVDYGKLYIEFDPWGKVDGLFIFNDTFDAEHF